MNETIGTRQTRTATEMRLSGSKTPRVCHDGCSVRGSAFESLAILDLLDLETTPAGSAGARVILVRLMAVLTALIRR